MKPHRKSRFFPVFFGILFAVCMVGLAVFVTGVIKEEPRMPLSALDVSPVRVSANADASANVDVSAVSAVSETEAETLPLSGISHAILFVGDSRTAGMRNALNMLGIEDTCSFIAKDGEGCYWLQNTALYELTEVLDTAPDTVVVTNLGVNDLTELASYISLYQGLLDSYPDTPFYIMSVNPASDDCPLVNNEDIESFNAGMAEAFPDCFLDCYHYLTDEGYETVDGLHYTDETYAKIHEYVVRKLNGQE